MSDEVEKEIKDRGGDKYWYQDEVDESIAKYKEKYGLD